MFELLTIVALAIFSFVTTLFVVSLIIKRNDIADIAWGPGIGIVAVMSYVYGNGSALSLLITGIIVVWALRLGVHISMRNRGKREDPRYAAWREEWGRWVVLRSYLQVYLLQGSLMIVVGYPAVHAAVFGGAVPALAYLGVAVWLVGFVFETVGDYQLLRFIKNPENKGRIMRYGLWKYTRHPNYFGEVTQWWGVFVMVVAAPYGFVAIISALTITFLILKVSGIPMLEKQFDDNPEFQEYKKHTSAFFPALPKPAQSHDDVA